MSIVRPSKLRHVYGEEQKLKFEELRPSSLTSEGHLVKCNGDFVAFNWNISGGGALCVLSTSETGRLSPDHALIKGHSSNILDFDFNPFNDQQILTSCDDALIRLWDFPAEGLKEDLVEPLAVMRGHGRKVGLVAFNPAAAYICASASFDYTVKVWSVETATAAYSIGPLTETCLCLSWDFSGRLLGTTWRDKRARLIDPRSQQIAQEFLCHEGGKASKFTWISDSTCFTCGFSKQSERQCSLWDVRNPSHPLTQQTIDQASGVLMPFFDPDTGLLFLAGKGDGNIRYYEVVDFDPFLHFIQSYKSTVPCMGVSFIPKRKVDTGKCEVMRAVKLANSVVEMISFIVPRRGEGFQEDLYPECVGTVPGCSAEEWLQGSSAVPPKFAMNKEGSEAGVQQRKHEKPTFAPILHPPSSTHQATHPELPVQNLHEIGALKSALQQNKAKIAALQDNSQALTASLAATQQAQSASVAFQAQYQAAIQQAQESRYLVLQTATALHEAIEATRNKSQFQQSQIAELELETDRLREILTKLKREGGASQRRREEVMEELERGKAELEELRLLSAGEQQ